MNLKSGISNPLTSMNKTKPKNTFTCVSIRHLAWILCDSSLIRESDLAMSSSGKRRQTNTNHHQRQNKNNIYKKHKFATNPQTCSCATCVSCMHIHIHCQESILPGYNSTKSLAPFQDLLSISPFLLSTDI